MSKTQTVTKPQAAKASSVKSAKAADSKARKAQAKAAEQATQKAAETQQEAPQAPEAAAPVVSAAPTQENATAAVSAPRMTLFHFNQTPAGRKLRAFFVAYISAQIGGMSEGKVFRLWPHANIAGHLKSGKVSRKSDGYALTTAGANYFSLPEQAADPELLKGMMAAVTTGTKPEFYRFEMVKTGGK